jgi:hypothetical protein
LRRSVWRERRRRTRDSDPDRCAGRRYFTLALSRRGRRVFVAKGRKPMPKANRKRTAARVGPAARTAVAAARESAVEALKDEAERNWAESDRKAARTDQRKKVRDERGGAKGPASGGKGRRRG